LETVNFLIRKAEKNDIDQITTLHSVITDEYVPTIVPPICQFSDISVTREEKENVIQEMLEDPDHDILVACIEDKIVGMLAVVTETYSDDLLKAPFSTIEFIEVYPEFQSKGIGKAFLLEAEKIAKTKDHHYLELQVWQTNTTAINLYNKNDFHPITQRMVKKI
jgi:ribosomal protein S18 acetylase RimI-like enzyme